MSSMTIKASPADASAASRDGGGVPDWDGCLPLLLLAVEIGTRVKMYMHYTLNYAIISLPASQLRRCSTPRGPGPDARKIHALIAR